MTLVCFFSFFFAGHLRRKEFCAGNMKEAHAISAYLASKSRWAITEISPGKFGVRIGSGKLKGSDATILSLKFARRNIVLQEEELSNTAHLHLTEAKAVMRSSDMGESAKKAKLLFLLKRKKIAEDRIDNIRNLFFKVDQVLTGIDSAHTAREVIESLEVGTTVLKEVRIGASNLLRLRDLFPCRRN